MAPVGITGTVLFISSDDDFLHENVMRLKTMSKESAIDFVFILNDIS